MSYLFSKEHVKYDAHQCLAGQSKVKCKSCCFIISESLLFHKVLACMKSQDLHVVRLPRYQKVLNNFMYYMYLSESPETCLVKKILINGEMFRLSFNHNEKFF